MVVKIRWFRNLKVRHKLLSAFFVVAALVGLVGIKALSDSKAHSRAMRTLYERDALGIAYLNEANVQLLLEARAIRNAILDEEAESVQKRIDDMKGYREKFNAAFTSYQRTTSEQDDKDLAVTVLDDYKFLAPDEDKIFELVKAGNRKEATLSLLSINAMAFGIDKKLADLTERKKKRMLESVREADAAYARQWSLMCAMVSIVVLLALTIGLVLSRMIVRPINRAIEALEAVAQGDFAQRLTNTRKDDFGRMIVALNRSMEGTSSAFASIARNAVSLATSSEELSAVSEQMTSNAAETTRQSDTASQHVSQVSEIVGTVATSADHMSVSIKEIAQNAKKAAQAVADAVQVAGKTNATVSRLGESSAEIGEVVKVINSIADQTNLLALNATIEAARAGEAGKGFAVVANEVKELAKQTGSATGNIGQKIQTIQESTKEAVSAITEITRVIDRISDISNAIASAVEKQSVITCEIAENVGEASKRAEQISQNVISVSEAAKSTSMAVSNTRNAAAHLARMASDLQRLVSRFKYLDDAGESTVSRAAVPQNQKVAPGRKSFFRAWRSRSKEGAYLQEL